MSIQDDVELLKSPKIESLSDHFSAAFRVAKDHQRLTALVEEYKIGRDRYEKLRKLNPRQFGELFENCLKNDIKFDDAVDALEAK